MRALADGVGQHAVEAGGGEQQGEQAEGGGERGGHVRRPQGPRQVLAHRLHVVERHARVNRPGRLPERVHVSGGVTFGAHDQSHPRLESLVERHVHEGARRLAERAVLAVPDHADDLQRVGVVAPDLHALAQRVFARPVARGESLVDDDGLGLCARQVVRVEVAPAQERNLHCVEVAGADDVDLHAAALAGRGGRAARPIDRPPRGRACRPSGAGRPRPRLRRRAELRRAR